MCSGGVGVGDLSRAPQTTSIGLSHRIVLETSSRWFLENKFFPLLAAETLKRLTTMSLFAVFTTSTTCEWRMSVVGFVIMEMEWKRTIYETE